MPSTLPQQRWSLSHGVLVRRTSCLRRRRCSRIGRGHRAEVHRDAVLHDAVLLEDLIEHGERAAGVDHEVFRDDFEPVHDRLAREDVLVVRNAQADADAVILKRVEAIAGHG